MAMNKLRNIKIDLSDPRTRLVIGGIIAVVIIVVVLFLVIGRKGAGRAGRPPTPMMGMMGGMQAGATGEAQPAPGIPMMGMMGGMQAGATEEAQPAPTRKVPAGPPKEPSRADPFAVPIPPEIREAVARVRTDIVPPPRITPLKIPMPTMVYTQAPFTRVAGIAVARMGIYALVEGAGGRTFLVSPGDVIEGYTVKKIDPTGVVFESKDGEESFVEFRSVQRGGAMPGMGMPAMGMPGMGMPGMGMPGMGMPGMGMPGMGMPGMGMPGMGMPGMGMPGMGMPGTGGSGGQRIRSGGQRIRGE